MKRYRTILILLVTLPYFGLFSVVYFFNYKFEKIKNASFIIISKEDMRLYQYSYSGKLLNTFPIAIGAFPGNKNKIGDHRTPEGIFTIKEIQESTAWKHNFKDGRGNINGAYGPFFIRLNTPGNSGIGIHGTHDPNSIGKRATEGCIRLRNEDILLLNKSINSSMVVVITPGRIDVEQNHRNQ